MDALEQVKPVENSPLEGKRIIFLGSSVTYGAASKGVSFADYIGARNNCEIIKEAVSGITLVDTGQSSYIQRLKKMDESAADLFVCQLSTNDATQNKPLGNVSESMNMADGIHPTQAGYLEWFTPYIEKYLITS